MSVEIIDLQGANLHPVFVFWVEITASIIFLKNSIGEISIDVSE